MCRNAGAMCPRFLRVARALLEFVTNGLRGLEILRDSPLRGGLGREHYLPTGETDPPRCDCHDNSRNPTCGAPNRCEPSPTRMRRAEDTGRR